MNINRLQLSAYGDVREAYALATTLRDSVMLTDLESSLRVFRARVPKKRREEFPDYLNALNFYNGESPSPSIFDD